MQTVWFDVYRVPYVYTYIHIYIYIHTYKIDQHYTRHLQTSLDIVQRQPRIV